MDRSLDHFHCLSGETQEWIRTHWKIKMNRPDVSYQNWHLREFFPTWCQEALKQSEMSGNALGWNEMWRQRKGLKVCTQWRKENFFTKKALKKGKQMLTVTLRSCQHWQCVLDALLWTIFASWWYLALCWRKQILDRIPNKRTDKKVRQKRSRKK